MCMRSGSRQFIENLQAREVTSDLRITRRVNKVDRAKLNRVRKRAQSRRESDGIIRVFVTINRS